MKTHMFIIINLLTTLMFFTSCKQDAEESFFFKIETGLLEWHVGAEGGQQEYIVESNAPWQIVHKGIGTWAKVSPRRSEGTGSFLITVKENESEEERSVSLAVQLAGKDYPVNITITQEGTSSEPVPPVDEDYPIVYNSFRIRDPFIFADPVSKKYYLHVHADDALYPTAANQIAVAISRNLRDWQKGGISYEAPASFWGKADFWAPDLYYYEGKYYMFATFSGTDGIRGASVLISDKPEGPFIPLVNRPITPNGWQALDAALFVDENKDPWIVFSHEWTQISDGTIVAQKLTKDLKEAAEEPVTLFAASEAPWVIRNSFYVSDAPFLYRANNGELLMLWSSCLLGKDGNGQYAIGVARSQSGTILGPWLQDPQPLNPNDNGGHAMIFRDFDGVLRISYHSPNTPGGSERLTIHRIVDNDGQLSIDFTSALSN